MWERQQGGKGGETRSGKEETGGMARKRRDSREGRPGVGVDRQQFHRGHGEGKGDLHGKGGDGTQPRGSIFTTKQGRRVGR